MRSRIIRGLGIVAVAITGVWLGYFAGGMIARPDLAQRELRENALQAVVRGTDSRGARVTLDIVGRRAPIVLFALSVDCPYCRRNLPNWRAIADSLEAGTSAEVLILSLSAAEDTAAYLEANRLPKRVIFVDESELEALGLRGVPGTVAIAPGEPLARRWLGVLHVDDVATIATWARAQPTRDGAIGGS